MIIYYLSRSALLSVDYTKYIEGQKATQFNYLSEGRVKLSVPYRFNKVFGLSELNYLQFHLQNIHIQPGISPGIFKFRTFQFRSYKSV